VGVNGNVFGELKGLVGEVDGNVGISGVAYCEDASRVGALIFEAMAEEAVEAKGVSSAPRRPNSF
jgi:hypothetical protein